THRASRSNTRSATARSPSLFFSSRRRHTISKRDWSSDVCSSDLSATPEDLALAYTPGVADACMAIAENSEEAYRLTRKNNLVGRSEERRVGKECRCRIRLYQYNKEQYQVAVGYDTRHVIGHGDG